MKKNNVLMEIPANLDKEVSETLQQGNGVRFERIISKGHTSPSSGWYDQDQNEWVMLVKGEAIITFEDREVRLQAGSYFNISAHTKHKVSWTLPDKETIWLAVFY